ncbi:MAG: HAD-IB family hydrolase [Proteobacteria bacterium]|nr:HAD-IB family hydrolase [Pseudomonadota bacterium]
MVVSGGVRHGGEQGVRDIVAFDFDGTLTVRDSFNSFLVWRAPMGRLVSGLLRLTPAALLYVFDRDRERLKSSAVAVFLKGLTPEALEAEAEAFCAEVWDRFMRPDALETWRRWGDAGAMRAIVTASPEITVGPFARRLQADELIGTRLRLDAQGRITGPFDGHNCRAQEKVERLKARFGPEVRLKAAYGDSSGDVEMLELAEEAGMKVFTGRP